MLNGKGNLMLNGKPVVLLDCDDVVARCIHKMAEEVYKKTGAHYTEDDIVTWDFFQTVTDLELKDHVELQMQQKGWCLGIEPFSGAVEGVLRLMEISEVFFVTAPFKSEFWEHERKEWLKKTFSIPHWRVMQGSSKFLVRGEIFVDDKPENICKWIDYGPGMAFLWDRPHNRKSTGLMRVRSWDELYSNVYREFYP